LIHLDWKCVGEKAIIVEKTGKRGGSTVIPIYDDLPSGAMDAMTSARVLS